MTQFPSITVIINVDNLRSGCRTIWFHKTISKRDQKLERNETELDDSKNRVKSSFKGTKKQRNQPRVCVG